MTASPMPQATALAETPPLAQQPGRKARDTLYLAEGLASRIHDIRNVVAAIDHIQQDRITGYADATCDPELQNACDQIASMHVMVVETLERTERLADELTDAPSTVDGLRRRELGGGDSRHVRSGSGRQVERQERCDIRRTGGGADARHGYPRP